MLGKILKDPLAHFLLIGALIFVYHGLVKNESRIPNSNVISVTEADIEQLKSLWQKQWQRPPTQQELEGLIENNIREQVFYREALAMGLDKDDTIVRRRLMQKLEFLVADVNLPPEPQVEQLREYYDSHIDRYTESARYSFNQIYFNTDQRGNRAQQESKSVLETLVKTGANSNFPAEYGDRFMLPDSFTNRSLEEISREFGQTFVEQLKTLPAGKWQGPITSGYGLHLVFIREITASQPRRFDQVLDKVKNDYLYDLRRESNERVYQNLRQRYHINVTAH